MKNKNVYNIVNNTLGWVCFAVAAVTYLLTIEPTASFWDCPEFISQGAKLEIGHPPGNPIFMLTARFFVTVFGGDITKASVAVNSMSALLSAATIMLLFWTITHLVRRIIVKDDAPSVTLPQMLLIMGGGLCGALVYTWSDTFWFSAVEGEVYAFSSFCTALVFWLILKWENHADEPNSDRYLILIAYTIGVSIAVHLLNLLCIPAIVLVFYYRKYSNTTAKGSLIALGISVVLVALILFGLVPGFVKVAQAFELFFVNAVGLSYNAGALIYAVVLVAVFALAIRALYAPKPNAKAIKIYTYLIAMLSGLTFISHNTIVWVVLLLGLAIYLFGVCKTLPVRILTDCIICVFVIFIGYSSYALLLIRASANTPMNQNAPDNVFTLSSYLNREQYGDTPLLYGQIFAEELDTRQTTDAEGNPVYYVPVDKNGIPKTVAVDGILRDASGSAVDHGDKVYTKIAKTDSLQPDEYVREAYSPEYEYAADTKMLFSRMYSSDPSHIEGYKSWSGYVNTDLETLPMRVPRETLQTWAEQGYVPMMELGMYLNEMKPLTLTEGAASPDTYGWKPSFADNLRYFFNYQLNHMYWRYFMWNFAGRQNDIQGNGEPHMGNWISGIPFIDNKRLGDQSLLPDEFSTGNKGHNVFYMLPLILGLIGLLWQSLFIHRNNPKRGIEQFWVVFFLFFMTGIAIVLYLNQPTGQPRERDYAFAGSFYAFSIWVGMGVPAISILVNSLLTRKPKGTKAKTDKGAAAVDKPEAPANIQLVTAIVAVVIGIAVPLQMVSQTWDDHDRSHRYTARDFGENYLNSLDDNAIIFTNGDNDTFPLWYAQEVDGVRTDERVINLSYLSTGWYPNQLNYPYYQAGAVDMYAKPGDYAYDKLAYAYVIPDNENDSVLPDANEVLKSFYATPPRDLYGHELKVFDHRKMMLPLDKAATYKAFGINPESIDSVTRLPYLGDVMAVTPFTGNTAGLSKLLSFDIVANSVNGGFKRPVYFATTVPESYYLNLAPYLSMTGLAYQVTPFAGAPSSPMVEKAYENIVSKFRWGGLDDEAHNSDLYLDETVRRMVSTVRSSMVETASELIKTGDMPASAFARKWATDNGMTVPQTRYDMARNLLDMMLVKMPVKTAQFENSLDILTAGAYISLYAKTGNESDLKHAQEIVTAGLDRYAQQARYALSVRNEGGLSQLGVTEGSARYNFTMFAGLQSLIDLARKLSANRTENAAGLDVISQLTDPYMRYYAFPFVLVDVASPSELSQMAAGYGSDGWDFALAAEMATMLDNNGFDRKKIMDKMAADHGLTVEAIRSLHPALK